MQPQLKGKPCQVREKTFSSLQHGNESFISFTFLLKNLPSDQNRSENMNRPWFDCPGKTCDVYKIRRRILIEVTVWDESSHKPKWAGLQITQELSTARITLPSENIIAHTQVHFHRKTLTTISLLKELQKSLDRGLPNFLWPCRSSSAFRRNTMFLRHKKVFEIFQSDIVALTPG